MAERSRNHNKKTGIPSWAWVAGGLAAAYFIGSEAHIFDGHSGTYAPVGSTPQTGGTTPTHPETPSSADQIYLLPGVQNPHISGRMPDYGDPGIARTGAIPAENLGDKWGLYFNQRDSRWAYIPLNGSTRWNMWNAGCYASAFAMVADHFGDHLTPADIARNPQFFDGNSADMWVHLAIPGHPEIKETIIDHPSMTQLVGLTKPGNTMIVQLHHDPIPGVPNGWDHFVVVTGTDHRANGEWDLIIRNPDAPDGKDVPMGYYFQQSAGWHIVQARDYHT